MRLLQPGPRVWRSPADTQHNPQPQERGTGLACDRRRRDGHRGLRTGDGAGAAADPVTAGWLVTAADEEGSADLSRVKNAPRAEIGTGDGAVRSGSMLTYAEPHLAVQARIELIRVRLALANVAGP